MLSPLISATHARCEALAPDVGGKVSGPQMNIQCEQKSGDESRSCLHFPFPIRVATAGAEYVRCTDYYFYALKIQLCAITPTSSHVTWCQTRHRGLAGGQPTSKQYLECGERERKRVGFNTTHFFPHTQCTTPSWGRLFRNAGMLWVHFFLTHCL